MNHQSSSLCGNGTIPFHTRALKLLSTTDVQNMLRFLKKRRWGGGKKKRNTSGEKMQATQIFSHFQGVSPWGVSRGAFVLLCLKFFWVQPSDVSSFFPLSLSLIKPSLKTCAQISGITSHIPPPQTQVMVLCRSFRRQQSDWRRFGFPISRPRASGLSSFLSVFLEKLGKIRFAAQKPGGVEGLQRRSPSRLRPVWSARRTGFFENWQASGRR